MLWSKLEFGQIPNLSSQNWNSSFDRTKLEFDGITTNVNEVSKI